jgi:diguanylate cyclase (GGDEF)-like protein/PAS domain S-box-containing protein
MAPLRNLERSQVMALSVVHFLLWGLGLAGITVFSSSIIHSEQHRVDAMESLRISEEKLAKVFQASPDWITISTMEDGRYMDVNDAFIYMTGYSREEVIGKSADELGLWVKSNQKISALEMLKEKEAIHNLEVELRMKSGKIHTMLWSAERIDLKGKQYLVNAVKDITNRKKMEEEIKRIAYHDALTGLPNRMLLMDRLGIAISQAERSRNKVALMMLDLDKFKQINDTMGHHIGDMLLKAVAERLKEIIRKADTAARFGGDEFVVILPDRKGVDEAVEVARRISDSFQEPLLLDGQALNVTISIGIAIYPDNGTDIDVILKNADSAMYTAKASGRNGYILFGYLAEREDKGGI